MQLTILTLRSPGILINSELLPINPPVFIINMEIWLQDRQNKVVYSVISKGRMEFLMQEGERNSVPHYTMLFAYTFNGDRLFFNLTRFTSVPVTPALLSSSCVSFE